MLLEVQKHVEKVFSEWTERRQRVEQALKLLKATLFSVCEYDGDGRVRYKLQKEVRREEKNLGKREEKKKKTEEKKAAKKTQNEDREDLAE